MGQDQPVIRVLNPKLLLSFLASTLRPLAPEVVVIVCLGQRRDCDSILLLSVSSSGRERSPSAA